MIASHTLDHLVPGEIAIHRHWTAYATLVRRGRYTEAGVNGRLHILPRTLVLHPQLHLHSNVVLAAGDVCNVSMDEANFRAWRALRGAAVDRMVTLDRPPSQDEVLEAIAVAEPVEFEQPPIWLQDVFNSDISRFSEFQRDVSREHAHRQFKHHFGMPPGQFRRERHLQRAIELISSGEPLAHAAAAAGFSDQSHMTRLMVQEFGYTPARLRSKITPVQYHGAIPGD